MFRPCIDLHEGKVKQIVGSTLRDGEKPVTNFESDRSPGWYAELYRRDKLVGGHVIMLGPGNEAAAMEALKAWPGGLQVGGGIRPENAKEWLYAGASHVIVTSYVFRDGLVDWDRLNEMEQMVSSNRLVLDLSCRKKDGVYYVVTDRWQKFTSVQLNSESLLRLGEHVDEFLVHCADVEGKLQGVDEDLVALLAAHSPVVTTYAGGVGCLEDMERVWRASRGRIELTIGSALDIFGGPVSYKDAVQKDLELRGRA